jgi:hypothetical protein
MKCDIKGKHPDNGEEYSFCGMCTIEDEKEQ